MCLKNCLEAEEELLRQADIGPYAGLAQQEFQDGCVEIQQQGRSRIHNLEKLIPVIFEIG